MCIHVCEGLNMLMCACVCEGMSVLVCGSVGEFAHLCVRV